VFDSASILWHFPDEAVCFPTTNFPDDEEEQACC
jgi:hypothetical protein